jgi:hypothetical protein
MALLAWHYTVGVKASDILRDGFIRGATGDVPTGERPIVWFSTRQIWEPTATKGKMVADLQSETTMSELIEEGHGLWRFGVPKIDLLAWKSLQREAAMSRDTARALARAAHKFGANANFWYGAVEPVAVNRCEIQCILARGDGWGRFPVAPP